MTTPLHALFVEDSAADVVLLVHELRRGGFEPIYEQVETPAALRAALAAATWDVVFGDYTMPHFSGLAALELLQDLGMDLPFIIVSGTIGEERAVNALKAGAHDYVLKDNLARLVPVVERELREAEARRQRRRMEREKEQLLVDLGERVKELTALHHAARLFQDERRTAMEVLESLAGLLPPAYLHSEVAAACICYDGRKFATPGYLPTPWTQRVEFTSSDGKTGTIEVAYLEERPPATDGPFLREERILVDSIADMLKSYLDRKWAEQRLLRAQRLETAGMVAGQVAHDFNNLLSPLAGYPELIMMRLPAGHPAIEYCNAMLEAARRMAAINDDLLTLGRRGRFDPEPMDLNRLLRQSAALIARPGQLDVHLDLADDLMPIQGSPAQLLRVVSNLLSNARDAMQDLGTLGIRTQNVYVDRPFGRYNQVEMGEYIRLDICDTGYGIPPEIKDRIFDPFFTTKSADNRRGSGLGLSVVQAILDDHRGYIDVDSEVGTGTTFSLYLPVCREAVKLPPPDELHRGTEAILVVDDDAGQRQISSRLLETLGYQVETVARGEDAVAYLGEHAVDLLLLDMVMPGGIDGAETYRLALEVRPGLRAIVISGFAESDRVRKAQSLGAGSYLRKPVTLERLSSAVRQELDRQADIE